MKLIVAGGRNVPPYQARRLVNKAYQTLESSFRESITEIVHGGATGIDSAAARYFSGWKRVKEFPADWKANGKAAGPIRNRQMAEYADALLAIWDGDSRGTKNMIETARSKGLKVIIFYSGGVDP